MNTQFITDNDKLIGNLTNEHTAVVGEFDSWLKGITIEHLDYSQLEAVYSIKAGIINPKISDIMGIHLVSSSGVIVAEQTDLSCTDGRELLTIIDEMVLALPDKTFTVKIEANVKNKKVQHSFDVEATHILLAVSIALDKLMTTVYNERYDIDNIVRTIDGCVRNNEDVLINFYSDNSYKLISVSPSIEPS